MVSIGALKDRSPRWLRDGVAMGGESLGRLSARARSAPDFLVIGTKRGGTTSLFRYLCMHPGVLGMFPQPRGRKSSDYLFTASGDSAAYRANFHTTAYKQLRSRALGYAPLSGESSPYYVWDPRIAARAYAANPALKAIMLVRDPVERAYSHWQERRQNGVEPLSFDEALRAERARTDGEVQRMLAQPEYHSCAHDWYAYRARGVYLPQIENWTAVFGHERLMVVRSEDMYCDVQAVVDDVCRFLSIPTWQLPTTRTFNASRRTAVPSVPGVRLAEFYAEHNHALEQYLGRQLEWDTSATRSATRE